MNVIKEFIIKSGDNVQTMINNAQCELTYSLSNHKGYLINFKISTYKGSISIPAGTSFSIVSDYDKGCVIDAEHKGRCITSIGATYLSLDNITLANGIATSKARYSTEGNIYLSEDDFNSPTKYNGGGCCIMGNTIVNMRNVSIKDCYAKGCGGGLYYDPCYNIPSMKYYLFPMTQYIIYKADIYLPTTPTKEYDFVYKGGKSDILLKSDNNWYNNGTIISSLLSEYASIPNVNKSENLYIHGYIATTKTESILPNIHSTGNRRGYQFHYENDTCNIINNEYLSSNKADVDGGGMYINNVSYFINGSGMEVNDNSSNGHGGGICIENTIGSMYNDRSIENGIILYKNKMNMIINNINCYNNKATVYGGGMYYSDNYNALIENCKFKSNSTHGAGGGLFVIGNQTVSFDKAYNTYDGNYSTDTIYFNGKEYTSSEKGYHNIDEDRYISQIKSDQWGEYEESFKADSDYSTTDMTVFDSTIGNVPNYYGWKKGGSTVDRLSVIPTTTWNLVLKLNNITVDNNYVAQSSKFDNRHVRDNIIKGLTNLSTLYDLPLLTGGGLCLFSANNISINNTVIENNKSDSYGGGLTILNSIPSINTLAIKVDGNTTNIGKGANYHFIGDHNFFINNNLSKGITKNEIRNQSDTFYSDSMYVYSDEGFNGLHVEYYNGIKSMNAGIKASIDKHYNLIALYRDYFEIGKGNEFHFKGTNDNNLLISQSTMKNINSKTVLSNKGNSRFIDVSDFSIFGADSLYLLDENVIGDNNNSLESIYNVSGGAIRTKNITDVVLHNLIVNNCTATYGGGFANFTTSVKSNTTISGCKFKGCKALNLGGAIFNYIYDKGKGYDNYEYLDEKANHLFIGSSEFTKCSSNNRGGAIFAYYNTNTRIKSTKFKGNASQYGNDCYISDQSVMNNSVQSCDLFVEGSTCTGSFNGNITKGLVYIDDTTTDIFRYKGSEYVKGIDKFYSEIKSNNIDNIKSEVAGKSKILYQLYEYDYVGKGALRQNVSVMKSYNTELLFQSRLVNRYKAIQNSYVIKSEDVDSVKIKGFIQRYKNALFQNQNHNLTFSSIKAIDIARINIKAVHTSFININDISTINISHLIGSTCVSKSNGGVININGIKSDINLNTDIELVSNTANKGSGGAMYAFLKGVSSFSIGEKATKASIIIANNGAINGGAFYIGSTVKSTHPMTTTSNTNNSNVIEYNSATYGGAIYLDNIVAGISNLNIINNFANEGGGIYLGGNSNLDITNITIKGNAFNTKSVGNFYSKNQALGGGIFISPDSYLTIEKGVSIENNLMYWGGGIFNDVNPIKACRILLKDKGSFNMTDNSNYNIYIVGNIKSVKGTSEYKAIKHIKSIQIESIDVGIVFSNKTKGRFFTYPIKGDPINDNHNHRLDYLFNDYINHKLVKYEDTKVYSTKSSVQSLDIKIYSDVFNFDNDNVYNSNKTKGFNKALNFININGEMKDFGKTRFESVNAGTLNFFKYKGLQFKFSNLEKGLVINNLYYDSFFNKGSSLYEISNMNSFIYGDNYHSNIYGYDTTNFKISSVKSIDIKSAFNSCYYVSQKKEKNTKSNTLGGFIKVDNSNLVNSDIYFNPSLKGVGSHCYISNQSIDTDYESYNLPIGGVCYVNNSNMYINEIKSLDGKGSIALDGGFIYKDIDDSKIISFKGIIIENYNSYHNGGAISLNRTKAVSNSYSLLDFDSIHLNNCKAINGYGGGIYMNTTKANFNRIDITNCTAKKGGGGIALISKGDKGNSIILNKGNVNFKGNIAYSGSQIYVVGSKLLINNINMDGTEYLSKLKSNLDLFKGNNGGAIYAESSELRLKSCTFTNFGAYHNGGVIYYDSNYDSNQNYSIDIDGCDFDNKGNNFVTKCGGAIYMINNGDNKKSETINISNSSIHHYNAGIGGGVFLYNKVDRDIILHINNSNIYNNTVKGNVINNIDTDTYDIIDDPLQLEGFGGGIFMNNIKNITFKGLKAYNNNCTMTFPKDDYYKATYNSDNIYTDTLAEYNNGAVEVKAQIKSDEWSDYFIPCGGGIFMMNGIDISEIKSSNTSISHNTPDDVFPSFVYYKGTTVQSGSIQKAEIYKSLQNINSDDSYIASNTHMWSLMTGGHGGSSDYFDKATKGVFGKGGRGAIVEFTNKLDIGTVKSINYIIGQKRTMDEKADYNGAGGRGAYIFYGGTPKTTVSGTGSSVQIST